MYTRILLSQCQRKRSDPSLDLPSEAIVVACILKVRNSLI
jgi:hypothetical protein